MDEEAQQQPGQPLRIRVTPRDDSFAPVADVPSPGQLEEAPWGAEAGDTDVPANAEYTQSTLPEAPWAKASTVTPEASPSPPAPTGRLTAPWARAVAARESTQEPEEDVRPMPGPVDALLQGIGTSISGVGKTAQSVAGYKPDVPESVSPAAAPYEMRDLWSPSRAVSKTAYALGSGAPAIASGIAGTVAGGAAGGPPGALAGGVTGAMLGTAVQTIGPIYAEELKKNPDDPDAAWTKAMEHAAISGVFSGVGWAAFPLKFFNGPIKNLLTQAITVQPTVAVGEKIAQNQAAGKPLTEGAGQAYVQGLAAGTVPAVGQLGAKVAMKGIRPTLNDVIGTNDMFREIQMKTTPMAAEAASVEQRAAAKDFANAQRKDQDRYHELHDKLMKVVGDADDRKAMMEAASSESIALQQGMTQADIAAHGIGTSVLPPRLQQVNNVLRQDQQSAWDYARAQGVVTGDGIPGYVPHQVVLAMADGTFAAPRSGKKDFPPEVVNISTTSPNLQRRRNMTMEETEAAAKQKFGSEAEVVKDIAVLPLVAYRLRQAATGREFINKIEDIGRSIGVPLVARGHPPDASWFTIRHPAFTEFQVRKDKNGAIVRQEDGSPVFDRVPIYMHPGFKGPTSAVLQTGNSGLVYRGLMEAKTKATMAIMYSPLIHNAVEWGRAFAISPIKVGTGYIYFKGNAIRNGYEFSSNPIGPFKYMAQTAMGTRKSLPGGRRLARDVAIEDGIVPLNRRFGIQDIGGIMDEPSLRPGRGWAAKGAGALLGSLPQKGMNKQQVTDSVRSSVDRFGDIWHGTLLWDRIADLQFGIYGDYKSKLIKKGFDEKTAGRMAAHLANRYAGALPMESMSETARKIANLTMFSRSFTLGNIGAMKDAINGLPRDVQAQIMRDAGPLMHAKAKGYMRRKARAALLRDIALAYGMNTALQSGMRALTTDDTIGEIGRDYARRWDKLLHRVYEKPTDVLNFIGNIESLTEMSENEPGRKERVYAGKLDDGTHVYARNPMGKIGEEVVGWSTNAMEMSKKKESTILRPLMQIFQNDKGFGRKVYLPDDNAMKKGWDMASHFLLSQVPADAIEAGWNLVTEQGSEDERSLNKKRALGPLLGVTFSKGAPGGPEIGEMFKTKERADDLYKQALPEIRKLIKRGREREADAIMDELKLTPEHRKSIYRTTLDPASRFRGRAAKDFYRHATPEAQENVERHLRRRQ